MALVWGLTLLEKETREPKWGRAGAWILSLLWINGRAGSLTRYSFAWLILPVIIFLIPVCRATASIAGSHHLLLFCGGPHPLGRAQLFGVRSAFRNASYVLLENTPVFPEHRLERSLELDFTRVDLISLVKGNSSATRDAILQSDLPQGGWDLGVRLLSRGSPRPVQESAVRRLRYFLVSCLVLMIIVQAWVGLRSRTIRPILTPKTCSCSRAPCHRLRHQLVLPALGTDRFAFSSNSVTR